jgi:tetratricopeptide (TPR) repeat protein
MNKTWFFTLLTALPLMPVLGMAAPVDDAVVELQQGWEHIRYQLPENERAQGFEQLAAQAHAASARFAGRPEPLVWEGIIVSSLAGEKGGLGALSLVKQAKALYEQALEIDPKALDGSAYNSLGVLYYKVPGWPLAFGDKAKAEQLLRQALAVNPDGIDPNYFFGEYLVETDRPAEAVPYLERALASPARPGRSVADAGRRQEVQALLGKVRAR